VQQQQQQLNAKKAFSYKEIQIQIHFSLNFLKLKNSA